MKQGVTFIDDLLDLDEPMQRGAFNKVATKNTIKELPPPGDPIPAHPQHGHLIESFSEPLQNGHGPGQHPGMSPAARLGPAARPGPGAGQGMGHVGMGPGMRPGMGHVGMGHADMGPGMRPGMGPGMGHPGMGPGMGQGMGHPGMGHPGMGLAPGPRMKEKFAQEGPIGPVPRIKEVRENYDDLNCRHIGDHIGNCPICSKLYRRKHTVYIIIIIILVVINLLCIKKILGT